MKLLRAIKVALICRWLHRWRWNAHLIGYVTETSRRCESWSRSTCWACRGLRWPTPAPPVKVSR